MPIPLKPFKVKCRHCSWQKIISPMSDVLLPFEYPSECAQCGGVDLVKDSLTILEMAVVTANKFFK